MTLSINATNATVALSRATLVGGLRVADTDVNADVTVVLTDTYGVLSDGGVNVGSNSLTLTGTIDAVNAALAVVTDVDPVSATDAISILAIDSDGYVASQSVTVSVTSTPLPVPPATTADIFFRDSQNTIIEDNIGGNNNQELVTIGSLNQWQDLALGDFGSQPGEVDILGRSTTGALTIFDIANDTITAVNPIGAVGTAWHLVGTGEFSGNVNETDALMQNSSTGAIEAYDIRSNSITSATLLGSVASPWAVAGFGDFSGSVSETDMLLRNIATGAFEVEDIKNNAVTSTTVAGQVGTEWTVVGTGDFSGNPNETDLLMRDGINADVDILDITNNRVTGVHDLGSIGFEWTVAGIGNIFGSDPADMVMLNSKSGALLYFDINNNTLDGAGAIEPLPVSGETSIGMSSHSQTTPFIATPH